MNIHEYQAKELFKQHGIPILHSYIAKSGDNLHSLIDSLDEQSWIVKAQIHAGGRGKAGGIVRVDDIQNLYESISNMLGTYLVTKQTDKLGLPINTVLLEEVTEIKRELYLAFLVDRIRKKIAIIASAEGGMDIEQIAQETPEKIHTQLIHPSAGLQANNVRNVGYALGLDKIQIKQLGDLLKRLYEFFTSKDCSLVEINPLIINSSNRLLALDAKINFDDNALYRHKDIEMLRDESQENTAEVYAKQHGLNYIKLEGSIGCIVNGAGLAMATMDLVKHYGGEPANFLDVGGGTTEGKVSEAFKLVLSDENVKSIFVNIFGGIVRCDLIAQGILGALEEIKLDTPIIVLLQGNNAKQGEALLENISNKIIPVSNFKEGAQQAIAHAK